MACATPTRHCPHCGDRLQPFALPENSGWTQPAHLACFNDECGYFRRGWDWMMERYGVRASYRYRLDPATGKEYPLAVWSPTALRDRILAEETAP
jgi:hypothetical protein